AELPPNRQDAAGDEAIALRREGDRDESLAITSTVPEESAWPSNMQARLVLRMTCPDGELGCWEASQADWTSRVLTLRWKNADTSEAFQQGEVIFKQSVRGQFDLPLTGQETASVRFGAPVTITIQRLVNTTVTDECRGQITAGAPCCLAISNGSSRFLEYDEDAGSAAYLRTLQDRWLSLTEAVCDSCTVSQLEVTAVAQEPQYEYLLGTPYRLADWQRLAFSFDKEEHILPSTSGSSEGAALLRLLVSQLALQWGGKTPGDQAPLAPFLNGLQNRAELTCYEGVADGLPDGLAGVFPAQRPVRAYLVGDHCLALLANPASGKLLKRTSSGWQSARTPLTDECGDAQSHPEALLVASCLAASALVQETGIERELAAILLLGKLPETLEKEPAIATFSATPQNCGASCSTCRMELSVSNAQRWRLELRDDQGTLLNTFTGESPTAAVSWNFQDSKEQEVGDGMFTLELFAENQNSAVSRQLTVRRDTALPDLELHVQQLIDALRLDWTTEAPAQLTVTDEYGTLLHTEAIPPGTGTRLLPLTDDSALNVSLIAEDECGNHNERSQQIQPKTVHPLSGEPLVTLWIPGLSQAHPVLATDFSICAKVTDVLGCERLTLWHDGACVFDSSTPTLNYHCQVATLSEGRHLWQAIAVDTLGNRWKSDELEIHYSPLARDCLSPTLEITADSWPPTEQTLFHVVATDNLAIRQVIAECVGIALAQETGQHGEASASLTNLQLTFSQLSAGVQITAVDMAGNSCSQTIRYPEASGCRPDLQLVSEAFGTTVNGDVEVFALCTPHDTSCIEWRLNGEFLSRQCFPEEPVSACLLPLQALGTGQNTIEARAWGYSGEVSDWQWGTFHTPVFLSAGVTPTLVQPWNGTPSIIAAQAELREEMPWQVTLEGMEERREITGEGKLVQASIDTSNLPDGEYCLTICGISVGESLDFRITIDAVVGTPLALLTSPTNGGATTAGLLRIHGTAATTANDQGVSYSLSLHDENGRPLWLIPEKDHGEWQLTALPSTARPGAPETLWRDTAVTSDVLAALDMSTLTNGRYTVTLTTRFGIQTVTDTAAFDLNSSLKAGQFRWQETDFTAYAGRLAVPFTRQYSTDDLNDRGYGCGWSLGFSAMNPVMNETRSEMEDVDGELFSMRTGGGRDITLTLPDGRRTTFRYALQQGGGFSFCYYARWQAPAGVNATLAPSCSNKLMTLPGLEAYWEATGPATPWEYFDFPAFILTTADGSRYVLGRENLGSHELLEGGEEGAFIPAYGPLQLSRIEQPSGNVIAFSNDNITGQYPDGTLEEVVLLERETGTGHVIAATSRTGIPVRLEYHYDQDGNLTEVWRVAPDTAPRLQRAFEYGLSGFPHHITAVRDDTRTLATVQYDSNGRMVGVANANGASADASLDVFSGFQTQRDALGRETLLQFDAHGNVLQRIAPGGLRTEWTYDEQGRETSVTRADGSKTLTEYAQNGHVLSRTDAEGNHTQYTYANGRCTEVTDPQGRTSTASYDSRGNFTAVTTPTGVAFQSSLSTDGKLLSLSDSRNAVSYGYGKRGELTSVHSDRGAAWEYTYNSAGQCSQMTMRVFSPEDGQEESLVERYEYDAEGHEIWVSTEDGQWRKNEYNRSGLLAHTQESTGVESWFWYDADGRTTQQSDSAGNVFRMGYDLLGRPVFEAGPAVVTTPGEPPERLVFDRARRWTYAESGELESTEILTQAQVTLVSDGGDECHAVLVDYANTLSREVETRDARGNLTAVTSPQGRAQRWEYDANGRVTAHINTLGGRTETQYGPGSLVTRRTAPNGAVTTYGYNHGGHCTSITWPDGGTTLRQVNPQGELLSSQDPNGNLTTFGRGEDGLLESVTLPELDGQDVSFHYDYDSVGAVCAYQNPLGHRIQCVNDLLGRPRLWTLALGQQTSIEYDGWAPEVTRRKDALGNSTIYDYDQNGRLLRQTIHAKDSDQPTSILIREYTPIGKIARESLQEGDGTIENSYSYNPDGLLEQAVLDGTPIDLTYDLDGQPASLTTPAVAECWSLDTAQRTIRHTVKEAGDEHLFTATLDSGEYPIAFMRPDGSTRQHTYDLSGRLTGIQEYDRNGKTRYLAELFYTPGAQVSMELERWRQNGQELSRTRNYAYDSWGRLVEEQSTSSRQPWNYHREYGYDEAGNRLTVKQSGTDTYSVESAFDANDRLIRQIRQDNGGETVSTLHWDDNGQLLLWESTGARTVQRSFAWSSAGRLQSAV
ncbi:MAG: RHS repeat protein, partial [Victivallales bacterium]|nr:RHS repeat protein [Victivallales bacterium]